MNVTERTAVSNLPDLTTAIGMAWIGLTVYERLWAGTLALPPALWPWASAVLTLIVAWSVLARKRWGRLALMGIAAATAFSGAMHLLGDHTAWASPLLQRFSGMMLAPVPGAADHNDALSALFFTIAGATLWRLALPSVRAEFEARKIRATSGFQRGIAVFLVACWLSGEFLAGPPKISAAGPAPQAGSNKGGYRAQTHSMLRVVRRGSAPPYRFTD